MPLVPEIPPRITPDGDAGYLEELTKAIFRAGFSWRVINDKWPHFQEAFHRFEVSKIAHYGPPDLERLQGDPGLVRNRRKLEATISNAQRMLELIDEHGSFHTYLRSIDGLPYQGRVKTLTSEFSHLGRTGAFVFLHCVNEPHPPWEER